MLTQEQGPEERDTDTADRLWATRGSVDIERGDNPENHGDPGDDEHEKKSRRATGASRRHTPEVDASGTSMRRTAGREYCSNGGNPGYRDEQLEKRSTTRPRHDAERRIRAK